MRRSLRNSAPIIHAGFLALFALFLVAPILVSASVSLTASNFLAFPPDGISLRWYTTIATDPKWRGALLDTIIVGAICTAISTVIGTLSAYGISRISRPWIRNTALVLFLAPLVVPYVSFGMAVYPTFAQYHLIGTYLGVALAQSVISTPWVVITVISTMRRRDRVLESAARTLGARPWPAFLHVVLPLLSPGIAAGAVLSFMTSFDDVIIPIFLGGSSVSTLPKTMLDALSQTSDPSVMAASSIVSAIGLLAFLGKSVLKSRTTQARDASLVE
jgi:ABC-type spermidine/putrescine transport system permease subunit II